MTTMQKYMTGKVSLQHLGGAIEYSNPWLCITTSTIQLFAFRTGINGKGALVVVILGGKLGDRDMTLLSRLTMRGIYIFLFLFYNTCIMYLCGEELIHF